MIPYHHLTREQISNLTDEELCILIRRVKVNTLPKPSEGLATYDNTHPKPDSQTWQYMDKQILEEQHPNHQLKVSSTAQFLQQFLSRKHLEALGYDMWCELEQLREFVYKDHQYVLLLNNQRLYSYAIKNDVIRHTTQIDRKQFIPNS